MNPRLLRASVATLAVLLSMTACSNDEPAPTPEPPTTAAPTTASASPADPTAGDFQTGAPDEGQPTAAPPAPSRSPMATQGAPVTPGSGGVPRGQSVTDEDLDRTDPDAVATVFAARLLEVDTRFDNRPTDANARALPLASATLVPLLEERPEGQVPGWFSDLKSRDGWTAVTSTLGGLGETPPDTDEAAYRAVTTDMTPLAQGWQGEVQTTTWIITLTREDDTWQVDHFEVLT